MLEVKLFEVRDAGTFIPCIGINMRMNSPVIDQEEFSEEENYLLGRAGYGKSNCILFGRCNGGDFSYDSHYHKSPRTIPMAHNYICNNWDSLKSGDVIDVEFIRGETKEPKISERLQ